jgi:hypothetical protein
VILWIKERVPIGLRPGLLLAKWPGRTARIASLAIARAHHALLLAQPFVLFGKLMGAAWPHVHSMIELGGSKSSNRAIAPPR